MALSDDEKRRIGLLFSDPNSLRSEMDAEAAPPPVGAIQQMNDAAANDEIRRALTPKLSHESPMAPGPVPGAPQTVTLPDQPVTAPLPPLVKPAGRAAKAPSASPTNELDAFLAQYGDSGEDADVTDNVDPNPPTPGLLVASEQRKKSNFQLDPLSKSAMGEERDKEYKATSDLIEAEDYSRAATRRAEQMGSERKQAIEQEGLKREAEIADRYKERLAKHEALAKEISAQEITEPSIWSGDFGSDMLKGISLFLLGLGAGPEEQQKRIQAELDRNLQVQKEKIANKRADWETDGLLLEQTGKVYESEAARDAAARAIALRGIDEQIARFTSFSQDPAVKARGEALRAQNEQKLILAEAELDALTRDEVVTASARPQPKGTGGGDPLKQMKLEKEYRELNGWKSELYVPAAQGYATDPEQKKIMVKAGVAKGNLQTTLQKLRTLASDVASAKIPKTEASSRANVLIREAQLAIKDAKELGALDKGSLEVAQDMVPSISIANPNATAAYDELIQRTEIGYRNQMRESGIINGDPPPNFRSAGRGGLDIQPEGADGRE